MVLSVSATFAASDDIAADDSVAAADEIAVDEDIAASDDIAADDEITDDVLAADAAVDSDQLSAGESNVVTKDNFTQYFNENGELTSDAEELVFEGDFSELGISTITISKDHPVKFTGKDATFKNVQFRIVQDNVTIKGFKLITNESNVHVKLINILGTQSVIKNITLENNNITFFAPKGKDGYAIFAGAEFSQESYPISGLNILNNNFTYVGTTDGTQVNNVIRVNGDDFNAQKNYETSKNILVQGNSFDIQMPSVDVEYSSDWKHATTFAEGIAFYYCDDVKFIDNKVKMQYNNFTGYADSLYVVSAYNDYLKTGNVGKRVDISNNNITGVGHAYIYGIRAAANLITIQHNVINLISDVDYANGISIDGSADGGWIGGNNITLTAPKSTYGIYAWQMNGGNITGLQYMGNVIDLKSNMACGMEINEHDPVIEGNNITAFGNFTFGIAASVRPTGNNAYIRGNNILCAGLNEGSFGGDAILKTASAGISTLGSARIIQNKIISSCIGVSSVGEAGIESNVELNENIIYVLATGDVDNYAVKVASTDGFLMYENNVTFWGATNGTVVTNGVYIFDTNASLHYNNFTLTIPAADIIYNPVPPYEETLIAEGIVFDYIDNLYFQNNNVTVKPGKIVGYYDTIRAVDISNSVNVTVIHNAINAEGNSYIYALKVSGEHFEVAANKINATSQYYTNGINVEGPASGTIANNLIDTKSPYASYPIYSGMTNVVNQMNIYGNNITAESYYIVGLEIAANNASIISNNINITGNHTIGIGAYMGNETLIAFNNIYSMASNEGNIDVWDNFGTETQGIIISKGNFTIDRNTIETTGAYAAVLGDNDGNVTNNDLLSANGAGNSAIIGLGNVTASGNPETKNKYTKIIIIADSFTKDYGSADQFIAKILDENGQPVGNKTIKLVIDGVTYTNTSNFDGEVAFDINLVPNEYLALVKYDGDAEYGYKSVSKSITVNAKPTAFTASDASLLVTATKSGAEYKIVLKDNAGNALANKTVSITFDGKTSTAVTNAKGEIAYKVVAKKAGSYKMTLKFDGDALYAASTATPTIKVTKEASKLTAKKKTFKAKKKTKKYTITLKDSKGKAISKVKVTLKVKGKTYKATTTAKGKATFKIKNLKKKGSYKATVKFAGNNLYNSVSKKVTIKIK